MNPYFLLGGVVALVLAAGGGFWFGSDFAKGQAAREEVLIQRAADAAQIATAGVLAQLEKKAGPIRERVTKEIRTEVRYAECVNTPEVMEQINKARQP